MTIRLTERQEEMLFAVRHFGCAVQHHNLRTSNWWVGPAEFDARTGTSLLRRGFICREADTRRYVLTDAGRYAA